MASDLVRKKYTRYRKVGLTVEADLIGPTFRNTKRNRTRSILIQHCIISLSKKKQIKLLTSKKLLSTIHLPTHQDDFVLSAADTFLIFGNQSSHKAKPSSLFHHNIDPTFENIPC